MLYNCVLICAISKYLTSLFIHRFTKKRYGTTFMPFYYEFMGGGGGVTKHKYICSTSINCVPTAINMWNAIICQMIFGEHNI